MEQNDLRTIVTKTWAEVGRPFYAMTSRNLRRQMNSEDVTLSDRSR
jgi:hypothetical protein